MQPTDWHVPSTSLTPPARFLANDLWASFRAIWGQRRKSETERGGQREGERWSRSSLDLHACIDAESVR